MVLNIRFNSILLCAGFLVRLAICPIYAQQAPEPLPVAANPTASLPDAPQPQIELADAQSSQQSSSSNPSSAPAATSPGQSTPQSPSSADPPAPGAEGGLKNGTTQNCPASQSSSQQTCESQYEKAQQQIREQEKQRVEGVVPTFNVTYHHDAVPLTFGQKMNLSLHSALDPFAFASAFFEAGYHEADNDLTGFPWGPKGYFERTGAAYLDTFDSDVLSNGFFPGLFREDPRYFRLGYGTVKHRTFYALATAFIAKNDKGKWGANYGNVLGNLAAGALSNLYYPNSNSGFGLTVTTSLIQIGEGGVGSIFNEFWPDLSRRYLHKDPTHGLDAQAQAEYAAQKQAKQDQKAKQKQQKKKNQNQSPNSGPNQNQNQNPN
jgi:hypothetical protein